MRQRREDRARADLRDYGHVVDRKRALRELHPPLATVMREAPKSSAQLQIAAYAKRTRARRDPGPSSFPEEAA